MSELKIMNNTFKIQAFNFHWINGTLDDPDDLCLHGDAIAYIGDRIIQYDDATISATALLLLKSITE